MDSRTRPREFLSSLLNSLPSPRPDAPQTANPLRDMGDAGRDAMLTLHVAFPNDLLPALDLLDRNLVTRFIIGGNSARDPSAGLDHDEGESKVVPMQRRDRDQAHQAVYYVRSAQQHRNTGGRRSHQQDVGVGTSYEVRLAAWNCSCPAFAFSAFPSTLDDAQRTLTGEEASVPLSADVAGAKRPFFGGLTREESVGAPPVCKHLLACALVERCAAFSGFVDEKIVSAEEAAGWAAGWGG